MKIQIPKDELNLDKGLRSGQCFSWHKYESNWYGFIHNKFVMCTPEDDGFQVEGNVTLSEVEDYFDLNREYTYLFDGVKLNDWERLCVENGKGIHILKQDLFETLITLMLTQRNKMENTEAIVNRLRRNYGRPQHIGAVTDFTFPEFNMIKDLTIEDCRSLGMGFRGKYFVSIMDRLKSTPGLLNQISEETDYYRALYLLQEFNGVGPKVAKCVMLFSLHMLDTFPVDTHIEQVINKYYSDTAFDKDKYNGYAGVMQQYMYYTKAILEDRNGVI